MEVPSEEGEMPIPLNTTYVHHGHDHHMVHHDPSSHNHHHIMSCSGGGGGGGAQISSSGPPSSTSIDIDDDDHVVVVPFKKMIRYKECLKNHAAAMGGNATDGCGEFMPSGEEGSLEALTCSACNCHRNFHRKEIEGEEPPPPPPPHSCDTYHNINPRLGRKLFVGPHPHKGYLGGPDSIAYHAGNSSTRTGVVAVAPHQMIMSNYNMGPSVQLPCESDEGKFDIGMVRPGGGHHHHHHVKKKRFRTKFSQEQKEKMLKFAEKVGWRIQKQEEAVVQQFCQEVGVKRRVLKVWMHNNKHNLANKNIIQSNPQTQNQL